jgi:hypothetical protein
MHLIILHIFKQAYHIESSQSKELSNHKTQTHAEKNFRRQLNTINEATTDSTIPGDFNLDENKRYLIDYNQKLISQGSEEITGHHHCTQHVK